MYQPKPGAEKYVDAICAHRKQQLAMMSKRTAKSRIILLWLKLVKIYRKIEFKINHLQP